MHARVTSTCNGGTGEDSSTVRTRTTELEQHRDSAGTEYNIHACAWIQWPSTIMVLGGVTPRIYTHVHVRAGMMLGQGDICDDPNLAFQRTLTHLLTF